MLSQAHGFAGFCVQPLLVGNRDLGCLLVCAPQAEQLDRAVLRLSTDLAHALAHALNAVLFAEQVNAGSGGCMTAAIRLYLR